MFRASRAAAFFARSCLRWICFGGKAGLRKLCAFFWFCCGDWASLGNWLFAERSWRAGRVGRVLVVGLLEVRGGDWIDMRTCGEGGSMNGDDLLLALCGVRSCLGGGWVGDFVGGFASGVAATHSHRPSSHLYPETWTRRRGVCAVLDAGPPLVAASLPLKKCSSMSIPVCSR